MVEPFNLDLDEYQRRAHEFSVYPPEWGIIYAVLGLSEAGEAMEKVKKAIRKGDIYLVDYGSGPQVSTPSLELGEMLLGEVGDILWYSAEIATVLGRSLGSVARKNLEKLGSRSVRGVLIGEGDSR